MSVQTPATLQKLAIQTLLKNEALAVSSLEHLSTRLFPAQCKEAYDRRYTKLMMAMMAAYPFLYLPVGALMKIPNPENLQAVLDGIDRRKTRNLNSR